MITWVKTHPGEVILAFLPGLLAYLAAAVRSRHWSPLRIVRALLLGLRLHRYRVCNVFLSRADYAKYRPQRTIAAYLNTAEHEVVYVGFWLAQGSEFESVYAAIESLVLRGRSVRLVLMSETARDSTWDATARYHAIDSAELKQRVTASWLKARQLRDKLQAVGIRGFSLARHDEFLSASAFLFDNGTNTAKMLVDIKFNGVPRSATIGLELQPGASSPYTVLHRAFLDISDRAVTA